MKKLCRRNRKEKTVASTKEVKRVHKIASPKNAPTEHIHFYEYIKILFMKRHKFYLYKCLYCPKAINL